MGEPLSFLPVNADYVIAF